MANNNIADMEFEELLTQYGSLRQAVDPVPDDVPLLDEDKAEFEALLKQIHPQDNAPEVEWDEYLLNQAKLGLSDTFAIAGAALETVVTDPIEYYYHNPSALYEPKNWQEWSPEHIPLGKQFVNNLNKWQYGVSAGDPSIQTQDMGLKVAGGGVRLASDPVNLVLGKTKSAWAALKTMAQMFGVGGTAELGGEIGEEIAGTEGRITGSLLGGVFGPTVTKTVLGTFTKPAKEIWNKYKTFKEDPNLVNQQYAAGAAKRLLELAAKEEGLDSLDDIVKEFGVIKHLIGDNATGVPLFIQMADNPVIQSQVIRLAKKDPSFRERVNKEINNIAQHIDNKANIIFGNKYSAITGVENFPKKIQTRQNSLINARQVVDNRIQQLSEGLIPGLSKTETGERIAKLVAQREKLARQELSPHYEALKKEAKANKVFMSAEDTGSIYQFVKANKIRDIFGKGTELDTKIMSYLKPKRTEGGLVKPKLSFEQVDSLKRKINEIKRKPLNATERRQIEQLEEVVDRARNNMPGNYNERLKALDKTYYEKIGVPFGSDTIKNMGSKKYIEEVVPVILKNESSINQFLNAAGKEGAVIARMAYGAKVYDKVVKNGVINMTALKALMKQDRAIIDRIPGMKDELNSIIVDNGRLFRLKGDLDKKVKLAEQEVAQNFLVKAGYNPDYVDIGKRLANRDTQFWSKLQKDMKYLDSASKKAINNNVRRQFLDHIYHNTDKSAFEFLTAPENRKIVKEVFGAQYADDLAKLGKLSDSVKKANVGQYSSNVQNTELDALSKLFPGLDVNYVSSQIRDRIASNTMKAIRILSRINQAKMGEVTDQKIMDLLLDPKAVGDLANIGKTFDFKINNPLKFKDVVGRVSETLPFYSYASGKLGVMESNQEQEEVITNFQY